MNRQQQYKLSIKSIGNARKRIGHFRCAGRSCLILIDQTVISGAADPVYPRDESPICHFQTFSIPAKINFIFKNLSG